MLYEVTWQDADGITHTAAYTSREPVMVGDILNHPGNCEEILRVDQRFHYCGTGVISLKCVSIRYNIEAADVEEA